MSEYSYQAFLELEDEIQQEFYEDVVAAVIDVNGCVSELESTVDESVIDRLFRAIHTIKGNCNMVFLEEFVQSSHKLEDLFSSVRTKSIEYHSVYGRFAVQVVNLIKDQLTQLIETSKPDSEVLEKLKELINEVQSSSDNERVGIAEKAIIAMQDGHFSLSLVMQDPEDGHAFSFMEASDIEFFEYMSNRYQQNPVSHQFYKVFSELALKLNAKLGHSADEEQLQAAIVFLHLSQKLNSDGQLEVLDLPQAIIASGILSRMAGWSVAAELCLQTMEYFDGNGTPKALKADEIQPAAQVLALAYDFACHVLRASELNYKQALFTAVKQINSQLNTRFKERLIQRFNAIIKTEYLTSRMF